MTSRQRDRVVCPRCRHENRGGARFCEEFATPLGGTCASCGASLSVTAKFCHACVYPVGTAEDPLARGPGSYALKHLAEKILTSRSAMKGERKQVTVLFANVKGSISGSRRRSSISSGCGSGWTRRRH